MLRAVTDLDPSPQALRAAGPSPGAITAPVITARAST